MRRRSRPAWRSTTAIACAVMVNVCKTADGHTTSGVCGPRMAHVLSIRCSTAKARCRRGAGRSQKRRSRRSGPIFAQPSIIDMIVAIGGVDHLRSGGSSLAAHDNSQRCSNYGRSDRSTKLTRGLISETPAGFRSRRGLTYPRLSTCHPSQCSFPDIQDAGTYRSLRLSIPGRTACLARYVVAGANRPNHFLMRAWSFADFAKKLSLQALRQKRRPQ
jgi:hypothetical protein